MFRQALVILFGFLLSGFNTNLKFKTMSAPVIQNNLHELTKDLLYSTESDYPFEVLDLGIKKPQDFKSSLAAPVEEISTDHFFTRYINILKSSGDPVKEADADRYKKLQSFINSNAAATTVLRSGRIEIAVYIIITGNDGHSFALKTISVET